MEFGTLPEKGGDELSKKAQDSGQNVVEYGAQQASNAVSGLGDAKDTTVELASGLADAALDAVDTGTKAARSYKNIAVKFLKGI